MSMTESEAIELMLIEKECINRDCDRDCATCDIVQKLEDLNNAYNMAIKALEKQIPNKPIKNKSGDSTCMCGLIIRNRNKINCLYYCHNCGQKLDWSDEE